MNLNNISLIGIVQRGFVSILGLAMEHLQPIDRLDLDVPHYNVSAFIVIVVLRNDFV